MARGVTVQVRLNESERDRLRQLAEESKMTVSDFVRQQLGLDRTVVSKNLRVAERQPRADAVTEMLAQMPFGCPGAGCSFRAGSSKARCPVHNRQVR